jgi:hypothetical protein
MDSPNVICMIAYQERHEFHGLKHMAIPLFGAIANLACMAFYIIGPIEGPGQCQGAADGCCDRCRMGFCTEQSISRATPRSSAGAR